MNSLSILIYLVDVIESIGNALMPLTIFSISFAILSGIAYVISVLNSLGTNSYYASERATAEQFKPYALKGFKWAISLLVIFGLVNVAIPSKQTMILIAASEVSEFLITSEAGQKAINSTVNGAQSAINSTVSGLTQVGGVSSDALNLLKSYIAKEQAEITKELTGSLVKDIK